MMNNGILKVNLSEHSDVFNDDAVVLDGDINFIYGENGTGKTTIATEINNQFSDKYNVCEFKDFISLVGEKRSSKRYIAWTDQYRITKENQCNR